MNYPALDPNPRSSSNPELIEVDGHKDPDFKASVLEGLTSDPKSLPCRFIYDEEGSRLFGEISRLQEYYLTRAENEILEREGSSIVDCLPDPVNLVELGSGSAIKTRSLLKACLQKGKRIRYIPIDISGEHLEETARDLQRVFPELPITAVAGEYGPALSYVDREIRGPRCLLWLGSSLGNLEPGEAVSFLGAVAREMDGDDRLLIGIDLRKDGHILEKAYDDSKGVSARFNFNILRRINRELGGNFDSQKFRYRASYDPSAGVVRMEQVSLEAQEVHISDLSLRIFFEKGETIHIENSYKYSQEGIRGLAEASGMTPRLQWLDSHRRFSLNLWSLPALDS